MLGVPRNVPIEESHRKNFCRHLDTPLVFSFRLLLATTPFQSKNLCFLLRVRYEHLT